MEENNYENFIEENSELVKINERTMLINSVKIVIIVVLFLGSITLAVTSNTFLFGSSDTLIEPISFPVVEDIEETEEIQKESQNETQEQENLLPICNIIRCS